MSNGINKVIAIGNCCDDPSVRYTPDGKAVTNITIACNESWKDKATGAKKEKVEFIRIVFFGGVAGVAGEYLKKGSKVYIEGKLQTRDYEKDGIKRYVTEVVVDGFSGTMQMLDSRDSSAPAQQSKPQQQAAPQTSTGVPGGPVGDEFDDIPF